MVALLRTKGEPVEQLVEKHIARSAPVQVHGQWYDVQVLERALRRYREVKVADRAGPAAAEPLQMEAPEDPEDPEYWRARGEVVDFPEWGGSSTRFP